MTETGTSSSGAPVLAGGPVTDQELQADEWARQAIRDALPRLRLVATAWGATVTAVTAIFGLATLSDSDDIVRDLAEPFSWLFGVTAVAAALSAAAAILFASLASQQKVQDIPPDLAGRVSVYKSTFDRALSHLDASRWLAGVAIALLVCNFLIRWYGDKTG
jgi:hypothetical protein